ncbi:MAG TPA: hypothetical protein PLE19_18070 [Planctomycetota bacterium]|nr:hypothetical protein [Planctomycetota bacterium]HRR80702.1 hypothetical protein [Planctomycetota bacterium]HRT95720.1 hypothetical protein [Planctomycetota bacterium]
MWRVLAYSGLLLAAAAGGWAADVPRADDPEHFTPADRQAMLRLARAALASGGEVAFDPATMPAKLLRATGRPVLLSVHAPGREPLIAWAAAGTLFEQIAGAAGRLRGALAPATLAAARLKLDLVTSAEPLRLGGQPVLGLEGLRLRAPGAELLVPPSEALRLDLPDGSAFVRYALTRLQAPEAAARDVALERLATVSFIERGPGGAGPPLDLFRGMPLVERVTRRQLLAAAEAAGDYLLRGQRPDGSFGYLYNAARDAMEDDAYEITRHAGTAWSLAQLYAAAGRRRHRDGAYRALQWLLRHLHTRDDLAWLEHGGQRPLGAAALGLIALLEYRDAARTRRFDREIQRLGRFLLLMQRDDGFFHSDYDPAEHRGWIPDGHVPLFAPGEAFLALVRLQRALPDPAWPRAIARAAHFMTTQRDAWHFEHDLPMIHPDSWTMMALDELHAAGAAARAQADYCLFLAHEILREQEEPSTARWRDHVGAPRAALEPPRSDVAAGRCEGLLAAWRLARRLGAATEEYRRAILLSAAFQLAHQYDAANSYLLPNPARAHGGFYASYADHTVRMDYVQHNLSALLGTADLLAAEEER